MSIYYDLGFFKFKLSDTGSRYHLTVVENNDIGSTYEFLFLTKEEALEEILSYAEIDQADFEE